MKLVRVHGPGRYGLDEVAEPAPGPRDVIVRVDACGICGTDINFVRSGFTRPDGEPLPLGHEAAGTVQTVGAAVEGITPGMRVFINPMGDPANVMGNGGSEGAFAREVLVRNAILGDSLLPVPDGVPAAHAALVEPLAVGLHGVKRGNPTAQTQAAVFGCGPIGLGAVLWLAQRGVRHVAAIDVSDERLAFARKMGAHATINPLNENLRERLRDLHGTGRPALGQETVGTDVFYDMAGAKTVIPDILSMAQFQARLVVTAVYLEPVPLDFTQLLVRELEVTAAIGYPTELQEVMQALPDIDPATLDAYISDQFPFAHFDDAFAVAEKPDSAKVMVLFD